jgi:hypothetical protein
LPVSASTSWINALGHTLASTPALIRCATSTLAGSALRVLAIVHAHRSLDGYGLSTTFFYLNSIGLSWVLKTSSHVPRIIHEHTSAPIGFEDQKAILQRAAKP